MAKKILEAVLVLIACASCVESFEATRQGDSLSTVVEVAASVDSLLATEDDMRVILSGQTCKKPFSKYVYIKGDVVALIDMKSPEKGLPVSVKENSGALDVFSSINDISKSVTAPYCGGRVSVGGNMFTLLPGVYYPVPLMPDLPRGVSAIEVSPDGAVYFVFTGDISDAVKLVTYMDLRDKYSKLNILGKFKTIPEMKKKTDELLKSNKARKWQNVYIFRIRGTAEFAFVEVLS